MLILITILVLYLIINSFLAILWHRENWRGCCHFIHFSQLTLIQLLGVFWFFANTIISPLLEHLEEVFHLRLFYDIYFKKHHDGMDQRRLTLLRRTDPNRKVPWIQNKVEEHLRNVLKKRSGGLTH